MGLGETEDGSVIPVIARAMLPVVQAGVRAGGDHPEGNGRAREGMAVVCRSDQGIDGIGQFRPGLAGNKEEKARKGGKEGVSFHKKLRISRDKDTQFIVQLQRTLRLNRIRRS